MSTPVRRSHVAWIVVPSQRTTDLVQTPAMSIIKLQRKRCMVYRSHAMVLVYSKAQEYTLPFAQCVQPSSRAIGESPCVSQGALVKRCKSSRSLEIAWRTEEFCEGSHPSLWQNPELSKLSENSEALARTVQRCSPPYKKKINYYISQHGSLDGNRTQVL